MARAAEIYGALRVGAPDGFYAAGGTPSLDLSPKVFEGKDLGLDFDVDLNDKSPAGGPDFSF